MSKISRCLLGAALLLSGLTSQAQDFVGGRTDFRDETIYFAMTTRFYDGDQSNNTYCWDGKNNVNDPEWRGDFKGLIEKLDYIKALGFTAIWITPVVENASGLDYHGYHAINFSKVDPRYESDDAKFQDLIDAAHARGMKIVLDIVLQHTGNFGEENLCPEFTKDYSANQSNINKVLKLHPNTQLPANYFDLPANSQYQARLALMKNTDGKNHDNHNYWHHYGGGWNWDEPNRVWGQIAGDCVDLNTENPAVVNYLAECYGKFIEMGVDAFRIDTSGHISRLAFTRGFLPKFKELGEKYKHKRLNQAPFFMFGEVCARYSEATYRGNDCLSPYFYTWDSPAKYQWDSSESSWDNYVVMEGYLGEHPNILAAAQEMTDFMGTGHFSNSSSSNAFLKGNAYHTPDYSQASGMSVIDFTMHWNFGSAGQAFGVKRWDGMYNDATWNVVYVDSHDYGPDSFDRYAGGTEAWAENMALMFTFRGIPCMYYGSEVEFRKGVRIDEGANLALNKSGRAYFGGYLTGNVTTTDFGSYSSASGNVAATLTAPLAIHLQRLNKIRAAVPALRKGQYSTDGCSGNIAFKRRYTDATTDSYCLVTISGNATFTGIENGTYTDVVTGDVKTVTNGTLTANCSGKGNMRVYVLSTAKTPAPGKVGDDGQFLYASSKVTTPRKSYDGKEEAPDTVTVRDDESVPGGGGGGSITEPETPVTPSVEAGEQAVFFENSGNWGGTIRVWIWSTSKNYTGGTWPGKACTYLGNKIWKYSYDGTDIIPSNAKIIFNNGSEQTSDMSYVNGGYYNAGGYVKTIEATGLSVGISPENGTTFHDTLTVTVTATNATSATYTVGTGAAVSFTGSANVTIGASMAVDESVKVTVNATDGKESKSVSATYKKVAKPAGLVVYWDNSNAKWSTVKVHYWGGESASTWPGVNMTACGDNVYTHTLPAGTTGVVFNNGSGAQTPDLTPVGGHIYSMAGDGGEFSGGGQVTPDPDPEPDPDPTPDPEPVEGGWNVYFDNTANWSNVYAYIYYNDQPAYAGNWPGTKMTKLTGNIYKLHIDTTNDLSAHYIIFNNNSGTQTADKVAVRNNGLYNAKGDTGSIYTESGNTDPDPDPNPQPDSFIVYWDNSEAHWTAPHIHYWGAQASSWPGVEMTHVEADVWSYILPDGTNGILFNAGNGDATKTPDFTPVKGHIYKQSGDCGEYVAPVKPEVTLYLVGHINGTDWSPADALEADVAADGVFTWRNVTVDDVVEGKGYVSFITTVSADWEVVNASPRYGALTEDEEMSANSSMRVFEGNEAGSAYSWSLLSGCYTITADVNNMTVSMARINYDANGDGAVNIADVQRLLNIISGEYLPEPGNDYDLNADGVVNIADVQRLLNYMTEAE